MTVRVATFNVENLFARYRFRDSADPVAADGFTINDTAFDINSDDAKRITAAAMRETEADILCLQEVENLLVLDRFNSHYRYYLRDLDYDYRVIIDGNDNRSIDVAVMSRLPVVNVRTHREEMRSSRSHVFSRDCLEVDVEIGGKVLTLYVNHLKSMIPTRYRTKARRRSQARRVAEIVDERWRDSNYIGNFIVLGDFNDYPGRGTALNALLRHPGLVNVVERLPEDERWTHYYNRGRKYSQLDYIMLSKGLADLNTGLPGIMRQGLPYRAVEYTGSRLRNVGDNEPKASDHAALYMDIELL